MNQKEVIEISKLLGESKAQKIIAYQCDHLDYVDFIIVVSGLSSPHLKSLAHKIHQKFKREKIAPLNALKNPQEDNWIVLDYGELIIHFFLPEKREYYDIEKILTGTKIIHQDA